MKLGDICNIEWGNTSITKKSYVEKGYPAFSASGQDGCLSFYEREGKAIILSAIGAKCGKCFWASGKWTAIKNTIIITPKDERTVNLKFIYHLVNDENFWRKRGGGQSFISLTSAKNEKIPLPPLEIQQKIVERLDKQQAIIEKAKEMEKAILEAGIDDAIFEGDWEWVELGEVVDFKGGMSISINDKLDENGVPIITINDISEDGGLLVKNIRKIKIEAKKHKFIRKGELLFNWRNGSKNLVGKTALYNLNEPALFASFLLGIKVKDSSILYNKFLWIILNEFRKKGVYLNLMRQNVNGVFNREELKSLKIPLPPFEKQEEIVEFLDVQFEALEKIRKLRENAEEMIKLILEKEVFGDD